MINRPPHLQGAQDLTGLESISETFEDFSNGDFYGSASDLKSELGGITEQINLLAPDYQVARDTCREL
jgi:hypothetical protein